MTEREAFYSVDRLERAVAVLVGDDGVGLDVDARGPRLAATTVDPRLDVIRIR